MTAEQAILGIVACVAGLLLVRIAPGPARREDRNDAIERAARAAEERREAEAAARAGEASRRIERANGNRDRRGRLDDLGDGL